MSENSKHTPGPWPLSRTSDGKRYIVGDGLVEGPNGYEVAEVYADDCNQEEAAANAALIAAAPETAAERDRLREVNKELVEALKEAEDGLATSYQVCDYPANGRSRQDDALRTVRAALSKARGV